MENKYSKEKYSLSIVLPCFNIAKYLKRSMNSILMQDYHNYEIIIVNDGSTDNILDVCKQWENLSNFRIITTINQGLSQARNEGLQIAIGDYVYFMDPDDYLSDGMFSYVMNILEEYPYDAIEFGAHTIEEYRDVDYSYDEICESHVYRTNEEIMRDFFPKVIGFGQKDLDMLNTDNPWINKQFPAVWRFIYRREFLSKNNLRFVKGLYLIEDKIFNSTMLLYANSLCCTDKVFYNYILKSNGLLLSSVNNYEKMVQNKFNGVTERAKIRDLCMSLNAVDIFCYYNVTVIIGALEIIVRGAGQPLCHCLNDVNKYLALDDVKEAFRITDFANCPAKYKYPSLMIKFHMSTLLVVMVHIANKLGIQLRP